jgi:hypothetical protein
MLAPSHRLNFAVDEDHCSIQDVRKDLQTTSVGLGLARLQLETGRIDDARSTLNRLQEQLLALRQEIGEAKPLAADSANDIGDAEDSVDCDLLASCLG